MASLREFFLRPMPPRRPDEEHRAATQLELFFDLVSVIAIATASAALHHSLSHGDGLHYLPRFIFIFTAIINAWINYSWFASSYDNKDGVFVILTGVIMFGYLIFAGGIEQIITTMDFSFGLIGWIIMRLGMIALWLRAARHSEGAYKTTAYAMAGGFAVLQLLWIIFYFTVPANSPAFMPLGAIILALEIATPLVLARKGQMTFHPEHMAERYGLLNIIVLGEILLSISFAFAYIYEGNATPELVGESLAAFVIVFMMWWIYFFDNEEIPENNFKDLAIWGYGQIITFMAAAFAGGALAAYFDVLTHNSHMELKAGAFYLSLGVAAYIASIWLVRERFRFTGGTKYRLLIAAALIVILGYLGVQIWWQAFVLIAVFLLKVKFRDYAEE